jgi:F0F1-type ATP synthase membrane subunit b/b'
MLSFEETTDTTAPPAREGRTSAARVLELAATTADQLVADAKTEAESMVEAARADAGVVRQELADERAALEAQIAALHQLQADHRTQMRRHLTEQLSLLDAVMPEARAAVTG